MHCPTCKESPTVSKHPIKNPSDVVTITTTTTWPGVQYVQLYSTAHLATWLAIAYSVYSVYNLYTAISLQLLINLWCGNTLCV